jgi:outer membrane protein OmpA-like peptidoglycan-associated protein
MTSRKPLAALCIPGGALALLALSSSTALAQAPSIDTEYVRPSFGADSFSGVDVPTTTKPMTGRFGAALMYTQDPVTLWDRLANEGRGEEIGAIVPSRFSLMLGGSLDLSDRVTFNALVPVAYNTSAEAGEPEDFEAPGVGLQDIGFGGRITFLRSRNKKFNMGLKAGVIVPSGREQAYLGDTGFRPHGGLLTSLQVGRVLFATDLQVMARTAEIDIDEDLDLGSELLANAAIRYKLPDATRLGVHAQFLSKSTLDKLFEGGGENGAEVLGGLNYYASRRTTLDVTAGRGLTRGYGTTDLRILAGLTVEWAPREPVELPPVIPKPPVVPDPPVLPPPDPEPVVEEQEFIVITEDSIEVKQRLEFRVGTTTLLDKSRPTLKGLADYVNGEWRIAHLQIVGHASAEGSYEYNYNLSQGRARTIWQELIELGVHPDRISYKGMGEVVPRDMSRVNRELTEEEMQDNRRVEFNIIKKYDPLEENPFEGYQSTIKAPWNGQPIRVVVPEKPVEEPEPEPDDTDDFEGDFDLDDIEEGMEE